MKMVVNALSNSHKFPDVNAICFSGQCFLKVLSRGAAPKLTLMSHTTPHAYEMARLDVSS